MTAERPLVSAILPLSLAFSMAMTMAGMTSQSSLAQEAEATKSSSTSPAQVSTEESNLEQTPVPTGVAPKNAAPMNTTPAANAAPTIILAPAQQGETALPVENSEQPTALASDPVSQTSSVTTMKSPPSLAMDCVLTRGSQALPLPQAPDCKTPEPTETVTTGDSSATDGTPILDRNDPANDLGIIAEDGPGIESGALDSVDIAGVGILQGDDGLGDDLWLNGDRKRLLALLGKANALPTSSAMTELQRQLLLTSAPWPEANLQGRKLEEGQILGMDAVTLRHLALFDRGEYLAALHLSSLAPGSNDDLALKRILTETRLAAGDFSFCADLPNAETVESEPDSFWLKSRILCAALNKDSERAELLYGALEERGENDSALLEAIFVLAGDEPGLDKLDNRDLFSVATLTLAGIKVPAKTVGDRADDIPQQLLILKNPLNSLNERLTLAESMVEAGLPVSGQLRALWRKLEFAPEIRANPRRALAATPTTPAAPTASDGKINAPAIKSTDNAGLSSGHALALFWQHVESQSDPFNQLLALQEFWLLARQQEQLALAMQVSQPILNSIETQPALIDRAHDLVLAQALNGDYDKAMAWDRMARNIAASGDAAAAETARRNWGPLMLLRPDATGIPAADFTLWANSLYGTGRDDSDNKDNTADKLTPDPTKGPHIAETALMLQALGHRLEGSLWHNLAAWPMANDRQEQLHPAVIQKLKMVLETASRGEALLMLLQHLDGRDVLQLAARDFADLLSLLVKADAGDTARALAVERFVSL